MLNAVPGDWKPRQRDASYEKMSCSKFQVNDSGHCGEPMATAFLDQIATFD